jgi:hypothetical protein
MIVLRHIAYVLLDVPAMAERVVELPVQIAPEHLLHGLTRLGTRLDRTREHRLGVVDLEREHHCRTADRRRCEHGHLRELVRQVHAAAADAELERHEPPVGGRDPADLLGAERVAVEGSGALGALHDDVRSDWHGATLALRPTPVLNVLAPTLPPWSVSGARPARRVCC